MALRSKVKGALLAAMVLVGFVAASAAAQTAGATAVQGTVFWDENGNGERDEGEAGVPGIRLDALHRAVVTDEGGRYSITSEAPIVTVSLSFPSGTWPTAGWFRRMDRETETGVDFGLRRDEQGLPFVFVQLTDPHGSEAMALEKMRRECEAMPLRPRLYICTGDVRSGSPTVRDVPDLERSYGRIGRTFQDFEAPLFMVPGNHDTVEFTWDRRWPLTEEDIAHPLFGSRCWERYVCPSHWSFSYGGLHFIGVEYAEYADGRWDNLSPDTSRWLKDGLDATPAGERTVLCAHWPSLGQVVVDHGMTLGLFGDSHNEGRHYQPGSEVPEFPWNVLVGGLAMPSREGEGPHWCQDGRPAGYRILVVEEARIDTFYKAFDQPHTIMVNEPRRFVAVKAPDEFVVRGQFFDPRGEVSQVKVELAGREAETSFVRRRLWGDFEATADTSGLADGFYDLTVTTTAPDGSHSLTEPYLVLTGRQAAFVATGAATLTGRIGNLKGPCTVQVNGRPVGVLRPESRGRPFSLDVAPTLLARLNRVSLRPQDGAEPHLPDVGLRYDGREFIDHHRVFAWYYDPVLRRGNELHFDLESPGPPVRWRMRSEGP